MCCMRMHYTHSQSPQYSGGGLPVCIIYNPNTCTLYITFVTQCVQYLPQYLCAFLHREMCFNHTSQCPPSLHHDYSMSQTKGAGAQPICLEISSEAYVIYRLYSEAASSAMLMTARSLVSPCVHMRTRNSYYSITE